jgi:molybdenum cofactor cytidylyltransferase
LITLVDQVHLTVLHLEALVDAWRDGTPAVASGYGGTLGVPALFDARTFGSLLTLEGDRGGARVLRSLEGVVVVPWEEGVVDVDSQDDVERWTPP